MKMQMFGTKLVNITSILSINVKSTLSVQREIII